LANELAAADLLPQSGGRYFEPFLGSGGFYFAFARQMAWSGAVLSDINSELIDCFVAVRDEPRELWAQVSTLMHDWQASADKRAYYERTRAVEPSELLPVPTAARFLFLNSLCFNGLYRTNAAGKFNVPMGRRRVPPSLTEESLLDASHGLQGTELLHSDYREAVATAGAGDFVVMDPPYFAGATARAFTQYNGTRFGLEDLESVREVFCALSERGCAVVLTQARAAVAHFSDIATRTLELRRKGRIAANVESRRSVSEFAFLNYDPETGEVQRG